MNAARHRTRHSKHGIDKGSLTAERRRTTVYRTHVLLWDLHVEWLELFPGSYDHVDSYSTELFIPLNGSSSYCQQMKRVSNFFDT